MKKRNLIVAKGQKHGTLYVVEVSKNEARIVERVGTYALCHQRFIHMIKEGMRKLVSSGRMPNSKIV